MKLDTVFSRLSDELQHSSYNTIKESTRASTEIDLGSFLGVHERKTESSSGAKSSGGRPDIITDS